VQILDSIKSALTGLPASTYPSLENLKLAKPAGCDVCHHFGYDGRISILEELELTPTIEKLIAGGTAATTGTTTGATGGMTNSASTRSDGREDHGKWGWLGLIGLVGLLGLRRQPDAGHRVDTTRTSAQR